MKKALLAGVAALFLATGAAPAQAINWQVWKCPHGLFVDLQNEKDENWKVTETVAVIGVRVGTRKSPQVKFKNHVAYLNGRPCKPCPSGENRC